MPHVTEIAPDVYRISVFYPQINLQFNHFLVKDDEPLLFHTGLRGMFPEVRAGVAQVIDPAKLRWISWSHFESDECGALHDWLAIAPHAQPACGMVGALVNINDFCGREARILSGQDDLQTGRYRFRYYSTPQLPHGWDAGVLFEQTEGTLFCSDLFHHDGDVAPLVHTSVAEKVRQTLSQYQAGPLAHYVPYTRNTDLILQGLASLNPKTLAVMHGSSFSGDGSQAIRELAVVMKDVLDQASYRFGM
ncbi:MAG: MBL fold metallo-hydrolase [Acidobacteria bacterium]|nr:MBL fold metallo-hydrolase [Acidobacteriota bacterium]